MLVEIMHYFRINSHEWRIRFLKRNELWIKLCNNLHKVLELVALNNSWMLWENEPYELGNVTITNTKQHKGVRIYVICDTKCEDSSGARR